MIILYFVHCSEEEAAPAREHSSAPRQPRCLLYKSHTQHFTASSQEPEQSHIADRSAHPPGGGGGKIPTRWGGRVTPGERAPKWRGLVHPSDSSLFLRLCRQSPQDAAIQPPTGLREGTYKTDVCLWVNCI